MLSLGHFFEYNAPKGVRPIPAVLVLFGLAFALYVTAIVACRHRTADKRSLAIIIVGSIAFRVILLPSTPIQEVDIYRYLWDGAVLAEGTNPFRYSPHQVINAESADTGDENFNSLVHLRDTDAGLRTALDRIHYGELPTVYPPASQAVFTAAALTTPVGASIKLRILIMKAWLLGFDVATLLLVIWLLRISGLPAVLCVIYGWCPLLMKEIANSGHLDSIAVFFTILGLCLVATIWRRRFCEAPESAGQGRGGRVREVLIACCAAIAIALAIGAKLYPVVLAPLLLVVWIRCLGFRRALLPLATLGITTVAILWPMIPRFAPAPDATRVDEAAASQSITDPSSGLRAFLTRWEMNDFLFLLVIENVKPADAIPEGQTAWFSVVPESSRAVTIAPIAERFQIDTWQASFLLTRFFTACVFLGIVIWLSWRTARRDGLPDLLEAAFLTLAWFWLLSPTLNTWYWTWALPLLPWARSRAWLAVSGLVLLYYLRFWLRYQFPESPLLGTPYTGQVFFDLVVTWIEFAPWFVWLSMESLLRKKPGQGRGANSATPASLDVA